MFKEVGEKGVVIKKVKETFQELGLIKNSKCYAKLSSLKIGINYDC